MHGVLTYIYIIHASHTHVTYTTMHAMLLRACNTHAPIKCVCVCMCMCMDEIRQLEWEFMNGLDASMVDGLPDKMDGGD